MVRLYTDMISCKVWQHRPGNKIRDKYNNYLHKGAGNKYNTNQIITQLFWCCFVWWLLLLMLFLLLFLLLMLFRYPLRFIWGSLRWKLSFGECGGMVGCGGQCWCADSSSYQTQLNWVGKDTCHALWGRMCITLVIFVHLEDKKWKKPLPGRICGWHFQLTHKIAKSEKS